MALTVAQLVARLTADTSGFYRGMALANSSMIRTGGIIGRVAAGSGIALAGMGILALRSAGNFQQSMNVLQAVTGATETQFKSLHDEAIALGRDMKLPNVSAKDAAEAMTELGKAGMSTKDILGATRGALQFGVAANIGFADSANLISRSLIAFNLQGNQSVRVADLFTAAANKSTASAQDIALGFQMASANFAMTGQSVEDLTTSLTIMANAGIVGSDAGTSLKTMMSRLYAPTKKAKGVMKELGVEVYDSSGHFKKMPGLIDTVTKATKGMGEEERNAALYTIFGSDATRAAFRVLMQGRKGWDKMRESVTKGGEAQKMAEARTRGFNGAVQALFSGVETLAIELGEAMLPAAEKATRALARFVNNIDPDKIIGFFSAIADGVKWFYNLVKGSDAVQYALAGVVGALTGLFVAQKLIAMFRALQVAWMVLNAAFIASPIGLVVLAIGALIGALVLAYLKIEGFRNAVDAAFSWIKKNVLPIMQDIVNGIRNHWDEIKQTFFTALKVIQFWWENTWGRIFNFVVQNWNKISAVIDAVLSGILIMIRGYMKYIEGVINLVMGIIKGDWGRAWEGIKQIVDGIFGTMVRLIINALTKLVPAVLSLAWAIGKAIIAGILKGLGNLVTWIGEKIHNGIAGAISGVTGWVGGAASAIGRAIVDGIMSGITGLASRLGNAIGDAARGALGIAKSAIHAGSPSKLAADEVGKPIGEGIIMGFLTGVGDLPAKISETLKAALDKGKSTVDGYMEQYKTAFSNLASEAMTAFDRITQAHQTKSEKLLDSLVSQHDVAEFKKRIQEARSALNEANAAVANFDPSQFESPEAAAAALKQLQDDQASAQDAWNQVMYDKKKMALEAQAAKERENYEERRRLQRNHLEQEFTSLEAWLAKHPLAHKKNQERILAMLRKYGISYHEIGTVLSREFAQGMVDALPEVAAAAARLADAVKSILRLGSPAKTGPLSDLDTWWKPFAPTLLSGLNMRPIEQAALSMAGLTSGTVGPGSGFAGSATSATTGSTIIVQQTIHGSVIQEDALNDRIRQAIFTEGRRGRTITT